MVRGRGTGGKTGRRRRTIRSKAAARKRPRSGLEFNHAMIYATDVARSLEFYRDALGFRLIEEYPGSYARLRSPR